MQSSNDPVLKRVLQDGFDDLTAEDTPGSSVPTSTTKEHYFMDECYPSCSPSPPPLLNTVTRLFFEHFREEPWSLDADPTLSFDISSSDNDLIPVAYRVLKQKLAHNQTFRVPRKYDNDDHQDVQKHLLHKSNMITKQSYLDMHNTSTTESENQEPIFIQSKLQQSCHFPTPDASTAKERSNVTQTTFPIETGSTIGVKLAKQAPMTAAAVQENSVQELLRVGGDGTESESSLNPESHDTFVSKFNGPETLGSFVFSAVQSHSVQIMDDSLPLPVESSTTASRPLRSLPSERSLSFSRTVPSVIKQNGPSLLQQHISKSENHPAPLEWSRFSYVREDNGMRISLYFPNEDFASPLVVHVRRDATMAELLGYGLHCFTERCGKYPGQSLGVNQAKSDTGAWLLRMVEDGHVDEDYPGK